MTVDEIIGAVRAGTSGKNLPNNVLNILRSHRCYALTGEDDSPEAQLARTINHATLMERYRVCSDFFENAEFPYAVIKGAVLSSCAYQNPFLRISGDVDILICRQDIDAAKKLLQKCGFIQGRVTEGGIVPFTRKEILYQSAMSHQIAPFIKATSNRLCPYVRLDVNMDILWGEYEKRTNMDVVLSHRQPYRLFDIDLYKLTPEMEFISLCLHHYKDMNSIFMLCKGCLRLGLFCDIYYYIRNMKPEAVEILNLSRKLDVGRYVYVCLLHTMQIFDDPILLPYLELLSGEKEECLAESFGLSDKERKQWDIPLFQRLFHLDLPQYMKQFLTEADMEKIRINKENM